MGVRTANVQDGQIGETLEGLAATVHARRDASPETSYTARLLTDVEDEVNGLFTYDRAAVKPDANAVRSVNAALAAEFARVTNPAKK
mgnify:CR=1 FL=1